MERSKRNARALMVLVVIALWVWFRSKEPSGQEQTRGVRRLPPPAQSFAPRQSRPRLPEMDVPALPESTFDVSKVSSNFELVSKVRQEIQVSEIFYHPSDDTGENAEFIELCHHGDAPVNVGLWAFTKGIDFAFPEDTILLPGEIIIVCNDPIHFRKTFGDAHRLAGAYAGGLKNSGETIRLKDREGATYLTVAFSDKAPWPGSCDGGGDSLQLKYPDSDPADPAQWVPLPPSPGTVNSLSEEEQATSIFGMSHHPSVPTSADQIRLQASASIAREAATVHLHLEISGKFFVHEIAIPEKGANTPVLGQFTVNLPPLPQNTVVRYWFSTEDSQGNRNRFPPLGRPTPNEAFWVQGSKVDSKLPVYQLLMDQQDVMRMHSSARSDQTYSATFVHDGKVYDQVRVRVRGAYARSWPKKSLKIFFNKDKLFRRQSRLNLNSGWRDPSLIREHMSYRIYDMAEAYSLDTQHIRLQVNGSFWGLFTTIRQPDKRYLEDKGLKGAGLYKADSRSNQSDERTFHSADEYARHYEKETREENSYTDLADFCRDLANTSNVMEFFEDRVQLDNYINFLCAGTLCQNWDGYNKNHFIGFDSGNSGRAFALPWDLDRTLGDYWDWSFDYYESPLFSGAVQQPGATGWNRMADRFFSNPTLRALYIQRLKQLVGDVLSKPKLIEEINAIADRIGPEADLDREKWGGERDWRGGVEQVIGFIKNRGDYLMQAIESEERDE